MGQLPITAVRPSGVLIRSADQSVLSDWSNAPALDARAACQARHALRRSAWIATISVSALFWMTVAMLVIA